MVSCKFTSPSYIVGTESKKTNFDQKCRNPHKAKKIFIEGMEKHMLVHTENLHKLSLRYVPGHHYNCKNSKRKGKFHRIDTKLHTICEDLYFSVEAK